MTEVNCSVLGNYQNQQVGVLTIMRFARKNKSNDIDLQTALLKSNSYLKIIRDNLYTELMQQTEVLLNSLSTVNSLEERYSLIANKLIEISSPKSYLINTEGLPFTIGDNTHYNYTTYGAFITVYFKIAQQTIAK